MRRPLLLLLTLMIAAVAWSAESVPAADLDKVRALATDGKCGKALAYTKRSEADYRRVAFESACVAIRSCPMDELKTVALDRAANDEEPAVRAAAAAALGCSGQAAAAPDLAAAFAAEREPVVRDAMLRALGRLGGDDAEKAVRDALAAGACDDAVGALEAARALELRLTPDDAIASLKAGGFMCSATEGDNAVFAYMGATQSPEELQRFLLGALDLAAYNPSWMQQLTLLAAAETAKLPTPALRAPVIERIDVAGRFAFARVKLLHASAAWTPDEAVRLFRGLAAEADKTAAFQAWRFAATATGAMQAPLKQAAIEAFTAEQRWEYRRQAAEQLPADWHAAIAGARRVADAEEQLATAYKAFRQGAKGSGQALAQTVDALSAVGDEGLAVAGTYCGDILAAGDTASVPGEELESASKACRVVQQKLIVRTVP